MRTHRRYINTVRSIARAHPGETVVCVTHGYVFGAAALFDRVLARTPSARTPTPLTMACDITPNCSIHRAALWHATRYLCSIKPWLDSGYTSFSVLKVPVGEEGGRNWQALKCCSTEHLDSRPDLQARLAPATPLRPRRGSNTPGSEDKGKRKRSWKPTPIRQPRAAQSHLRHSPFRTRKGEENVRPQVQHVAKQSNNSHEARHASVSQSNTHNRFAAADLTAAFEGMAMSPPRVRRLKSGTPQRPARMVPHPTPLRAMQPSAAGDRDVESHMKIFMKSPIRPMLNPPLLERNISGDSKASPVLHLHSRERDSPARMDSGEGLI